MGISRRFAAALLPSALYASLAIQNLGSRCTASSTSHWASHLVHPGVPQALSWLKTITENLPRQIVAGKVSEDSACIRKTGSGVWKWNTPDRAACPRNHREAGCRQMERQGTPRNRGHGHPRSPGLVGRPPAEMQAPMGLTTAGPGIVVLQEFSWRIAHFAQTNFHVQATHPDQ
mmetsp:Transcript_31431/g.51349  ORF Transcript_31431/g.51349 Transcript_31431/m.51349 type:complete len:174 (+) Transcript_31431:53-574(+)